MRKLLLTIFLGLGLTISSQIAMAAGPLTHFSRAIDHSAYSSAYASGASTQAVAATVALPLVLIGETAKVSAASGSALMEFASTPLEIADDSPSAQRVPAQPADHDTHRLLPPNRAVHEQ